MKNLLQKILVPFMSDPGKLLHQGYIDHDYDASHLLHRLTEHWAVDEFAVGPLVDRIVLKLDMMEDKRRMTVKRIMEESVKGFREEEPSAEVMMGGGSPFAALGAMLQGATLQGATGNQYAPIETDDTSTTGGAP